VTKSNFTITKKAERPGGNKGLCFYCSEPMIVCVNQLNQQKKLGVNVLE